jgi:tetratricopeptide (TPR) repeat protein
MESIAPFREALKLNPGLVGAYPKLGAVYNYFGEYRKAADLLKHAANLGHGGVDVYNNLGVTYYHLGQYPLAAEALNRAITIAPELVAPQRNLISVYQMLGRHKEVGEARARADRTAAASGRVAGVPLLFINGQRPTTVRGTMTASRQPSGGTLIIKDECGLGGGPGASRRRR